MSKQRQRRSSRVAPHRSATAALVGIVAVLSISACSVSSDREPRDVLDGERPSVANTTVPVSPKTGTGSIVYFLGPAGLSDASPLIGVGRAAEVDPVALFTTLFEGPSAQEQQSLGVRTAVPVGTHLLSAALGAQGTLTLDVSAEFLGNAGDVLLDAVVQIVYTAAQLDGERRVRLLVEGEPQDWPTSAGTTTRDPLSVYDFPARLPIATLPPSTAVASVSSTTSGSMTSPE